MSITHEQKAAIGQRFLAEVGGDQGHYLNRLLKRVMDGKVEFADAA